MVTIQYEPLASCRINNQTGQFCCNVYTEQNGVRDSATMCVAFADLTTAEKEQAVLADPYIRSERLQSYTWELVGGALIVLTVLSMLLYFRKTDTAHE
jgi:hypothetical protein